jgi:hypothetical protein
MPMRNDRNGGVATLWIGDALGKVERACLRSAMRLGHPVTLYCYREPAGVPHGVTIADAAQIVPEDRVVRYPNGSVALFSNLFRYEAQRQGIGTWIDTDVYLLRPLDLAGPYLFGYEYPGMLNTAVLRLPSDSPILPGLIAPFDERTIPAWLSWRERWRATRRLRRDGRSDVARMPWGATGPRALTALARRHGLERWASPIETFYPVHYSQAAWVLDPAMTIDRIAAPGTIAIHLWNEVIRTFKELPAAPGSFLDRLHREGA